ncbi:hypothetical protein HBI56_141640 [Parastagonospora nodorum]|nr:hypothetical protein HBH53_046070 [Parastagonospora nodorum]KAH4047160.1 hypothetical protein HBH49_170290 [Parastagonospora nodorum]KAH4126226.1 hypothetical protein HBH47_056280 [Parastagonospora nodorum]KAH4209188.1 hypothetical protein HBI95_086720 [Parastagonospora nodorum]KAH4300444.1 hypothetical protein HBI02_152320 [Parastagonospora nodorum]
MQASYTSTANKARQCRAEAGLPDTKSAVNEAQQSQDEAKSTGCTSIDGLENAYLLAYKNQYLQPPIPATSTID